MLRLEHKKLRVYEMVLHFVKEVYSITAKFPVSEQNILSRQMRRAAISVCSNLAEGSSRSSKREKKRFYEMSRSSLVEINSQVDIAINLEILEKTAIKKLDELMESIFRILSKMINNLR